jgi:hypothetical protein
MSDFKAREVKKALAEHLKNPPSESAFFYFVLWLTRNFDSKTFEKFIDRIEDQNGEWDFLKGYNNDFERFAKDWIAKEEVAEFLRFAEEEEKEHQEVKSELKEVFQMMYDYNIWPDKWGYVQSRMVFWFVEEKFKTKTFERICRAVIDHGWINEKPRTFWWGKLSGFEDHQISEFANCWVDESERKSFINFCKYYDEEDYI